MERTADGAVREEGAAGGLRAAEVVIGGTLRLFAADARADLLTYATLLQASR